MSGQLHFAEHLPVSRSDRRESTVAEPNEQSFGGRVVSHIVGIVPEPDGCDRTIIGRVDHLHAFTLAVCDGDELRAGNDRDPLRLAEASQALDVTAVLQIEHFYSV